MSRVKGSRNGGQAVLEPEVRKQSFDELGSTGLKRTGRGYTIIDEEFLPELTGERGRRIIREMRDNDAVIGAVLYAIEMLIRNVDWRVEGEEEDQVEFVSSCLSDMSHTWEDFIAEVLSMLPWGYSWHEIVLKRRMGWQANPSKRSRYNDGKIGWRKMPIRSQDSLIEWKFDDEGGVQAFVQQAPPDYHRVEIPIDRSLLFRVGMHKGNPEGRSLFRNAWRSWYMKRRIEDIEAVGVERDLAGLPVIYRSGEISKLHDAALKDILRNVRRDEQEGVLLPLAYDENNNPMLKFELLSSAGSRQLDVGAVIDRYDKRIAMTVLADFIMLGQSNVGSFALSSNKTELFATALGAILKSIAGVMNRHAIPRLLALNGFTYDEKAAYLVPGDVETPDLKELGAYVTALAGAGATLFPDDDLENYLRKAGSLPEKKEGQLMPVPALPKPKLAPKPAAGGPEGENAEEGTP
jgi:hypothetical protein